MKPIFKILTLFIILTFATSWLYAQNVAGTYQTDFNEMTLQQNGSQITGTYKHSDGRVEGTLSGNTLTGWWYQSNGKGRFVFIFNNDFSAFTGKWGYDNAEPSGTWNGKRTGGFSQTAPTSSYSVQNVSGTYNTDFNEMTLQQSGSQVTGTYKHSDGRIEGTLSGNTLTGWWYQSNGKGRFVFVFNSDFSAFTGKWGYDNAEPSGTWNGKKAGAGTGTSWTNQPVSQVTLPAPEGEEIFNNWNKAGVYNNPTGVTYFYLPRQTTITRITNYHWNNANGKTPGLIGIEGQNGKIYGTWNSVGTSGTGGAQNVNWVASPNITLPAGFYRVTDSDNSTWSHNAGSFGCGFTAIHGK